MVRDISIKRCVPSAALLIRSTCRLVNLFMWVFVAPLHQIEVETRIFKSFALFRDSILVYSNDLDDISEKKFKNEFARESNFYSIMSVIAQPIRTKVISPFP